MSNGPIMLNAGCRLQIMLSEICSSIQQLWKEMNRDEIQKYENYNFLIVWDCLKISLWFIIWVSLTLKKLTDSRLFELKRIKENVKPTFLTYLLIEFETGFTLRYACSMLVAADNNLYLTSKGCAS